MSTYGFYPCFQCGRTNEFPHCPCSTCARCGSNLVNGDCFNCSTYSSANNYSPNLYTTPPHFSDYSCHDGEVNTPHDLQDNSCVALCSYCRGSHEDYCCTQLWCENGYPICETCGGYHMDHECFNLQNDEFEEELKAQRIKDQEFLDTFKELCDSVIKKQREERERIAKEKEAEELEAERKKKECLKIENSLSKASTRSRRSRIDPSLKGFKVFCKTISLGEMQRIPEESVSSLKMGDEHLNTQKDSRESSVKYPIPTPRELDVIPDEYYDEDYQKRFDELVKDFLSPTSIYDNISIGYLGTIEIKENDTPITPDIPLREETPRYFYDGSMDNGEDIIPLMRISKETGLPEKIIDKSLSESFVSRMNVCQPIPITPDVPILETVNSLKMGEVHFDTSKDSFESSVRDSFSIPRESNDLSNGVIEDFQNELNNEKNSNSETIADLPIKDSLLMVDEQINTTPSTESDEIKKSSVEILNPIPRESNDAKECEISIKGNSMESKFKSFENVLFEQNKEFSSYDESSSKVENKFDTFKCFSNPFFELDEEIITLEKDVFQNEDISNQEKINDTCETERDLKFFDDLLNENTLPPDVSNVENDFQDNKEEIDISCDMIPPGIDTDDDSEGDVPPFEEPLDDVLFPLPKVDILPFKVEPVEVMFNYSHTYGENISQVERKFLSMVDDLFNLSNDDETFDPGGGENDVLLNKGENNDLNVFTIRTFLPFVTYPEVLPTSYSTGSEDKIFNPGIFDNVLPRKSFLTLDVFDPLHPPLMDFHVTKAFFGFIFSILKFFSTKFYEPGNKHATVYLSSLVWGGFHLLEFLHHCYYPP
ncbi:hypothetical protein Tco_0138762 [Tanacetum coccineum]